MNRVQWWMEKHIDFVNLIWGWTIAIVCYGGFAALVITVLVWITYLVAALEHQ